MWKTEIVTDMYLVKNYFIEIKKETKSGALFCRLNLEYDVFFRQYVLFYLVLQIMHLSQIYQLYFLGDTYSQLYSMYRLLWGSKSKWRQG